MVSVLVFIAFMFLLVPAFKNMKAFFKGFLSNSKVDEDKHVKNRIRQIEDRICHIHEIMVRNNLSLGFEDSGYINTISANLSSVVSIYFETVGTTSSKINRNKALKLLNQSLDSMESRLNFITEKLENEKMHDLEVYSRFTQEKSQSSFKEKK